MKYHVEVSSSWDFGKITEYAAKVKTDYYGSHLELDLPRGVLIDPNMAEKKDVKHIVVKTDDCETMQLIYGQTDH